MIPAEETSGSFFFNQHEAWRGPNSKAIIFYVIYVHYRLTNLTCRNMWSHPPYPIYVDHIFRQPCKELLQLDKSCWSINPLQLHCQSLQQQGAYSNKKAAARLWFPSPGIIVRENPRKCLFVYTLQQVLQALQQFTWLWKRSTLVSFKNNFSFENGRRFWWKKTTGAHSGRYNPLLLSEGLSWYCSLLFRALCYRAVLPATFAHKR